MKLFDGGRAPNPRRVRVFLAEKGIEVPLVPVDMGALEHRSEAVSSRNPLQRLPVLELDDGTIITESVAICRYFEELHPEPALFGRGALGKAQVEMWQRRMEFNLLSCVAQAFRHIHPAMKEWEIPQIPEWGEANKPKAIDVPENSRRRAGEPGIRRRRQLFDRRYHRPDRRRLHEAGAHQGAGGMRQCAALASGDLAAGRALPPDLSVELDSLAAEIRACRICVENPIGKPLPHEPRPVLRPSSQRAHPDRQPGAGHQGASVAACRSPMRRATGCATGWA